MSDLLATKLHLPSLPVKRVQRPHIIQRLNEGLQSNRTITLVSAPAGFGKTTCISEWVDGLDKWQVTWLSLDSSDDDPGRFFSYLIAALQKVDAHLGREIESVIHSGQVPPEDVISTNLINDISALNDRFILILDDFHVIQDRFILKVLEKMITNLPQPMHLVLITREDPPLPLARLRANSLLTEIRARDLRFTRHDINQFLNGVMGLSLSSADIHVLEDKTEGWIVGVQLASLSIRDQTNPSNFITNLSGSYWSILSYLTEQVLSRQSDEIQLFLLQTSVLEKLNGDLCNAVTGRSDSHALLEQLFNANLFLVPMDDERRWYRYHHLFADLLRNVQNTPQQDETAELHQRASRWYAREGMVNEAIQHALAGQDYAMAVNLLESHAMEMIMQGYAQTVHRWVQAIPGEWGSLSPRTNLAFAWMHILRGNYSQALPYLERSKTALANPQSKLSQGEEKPSLQAEWSVMQSLMRYMQGQIIESKMIAEQAIEIAPPKDGRVLSLAYYALASAYRFAEDIPQAIEAYQKAIQYGRASGNLLAEMMSTVGQGVMAFEHGQLHLALEIASASILRAEHSNGLPPIVAVLYGLLGEVQIQWCQTEQARANIQRAFQLSSLGGIKTGMITCRILFSRLSQNCGDLETAGIEMQKAADSMPIDVPDYVRQEVVAQQVRVCLAQHRPAAAEMALLGLGFSFRDQFSYPDLSTEQKITHSLGLVYNSSLRFLLYQAQAGPEPARVKSGVELASRLIDRALQSQLIIIVLETLLLRAQMHTVLGNHPASQADYLRAIELGESEGFLGVFAEQGLPAAEALADLARYNQPGNVSPEYIERILNAFSETNVVRDKQPVTILPAGGKPAFLIEPLTVRELDVLRLMQEGLTYNAIAAKLYISLNTVRFHIKAIYSKLNVNNRVQAIETAHRFRIM
jgi:LuxR family maltose regulon positive regulatory protein